MRRAALLALALTFWADAALAGPALGALAAGVLASVSAQAVFGAALRVVGVLGLNLLMQRRGRGRRQTGLQVRGTTRGATESETTVIGVYATKAHLLYDNSHGKNNGFFTRALELGGLPGAQLSRVILDGEYVTLDSVAHPDYGQPVLEKRIEGRDHAWIRFHDGTQTAADAMLVAQYADDPEIPWTAAHVATGIPYLVLTARASQKVWPQGFPTLRAEMQGIPMYDPRKDTSVGGAGPHRWADPATWTGSRNNAVLIYNILRGIALPDGTVWGGEAEADDLPLASWIAAMNVCDIDVNGRKQYQAGFEIRFADDEPAEVIEDLLAGCNGQVTELGGFWYIQIGAPAAPAAFVADDDLLATDEATSDPFPESRDIFNAVTPTFVSPGALWNGKPLGEIANAEWEAEDGGKRPFDLQLPAVFSPAQALQVAQDLIRDQRRWRRHVWPLPADYAHLRPLDTISASSAWNGYSDKLFEVTDIALDPLRLDIVVSLRERDPEDFTIDPALEIADVGVVTAVAARPDAVVPGFGVAPVTVANHDGTILRPGVAVTWQAEDIVETVKGIAIEVEVAATGEELWAGTVLDVARERRIVHPLPPATPVRARAKGLADNRPGQWTPWTTVTTPDIRLAAADLADGLAAEIDTAVARHDTALADATGTVAELFAAVRANFGDVGIPLSPQAPAVPAAPQGPLAPRFDFETARGRDLRDATERIEEVLTELHLENFRLGRQMTDAGIFTDPATGQVRISGVVATQAQQSEVLAEFDALKGTVSLAATMTQVNDAIAAATLSDPDLAALTDLQLRVSDVEVTLDADAGTLDLLSDALTVADEIVTMTSVTARLDSAEGSLLLKAGNAELAALEARTGDAEILLDTLDVPGIGLAVSDRRVLREDIGADEDDTVAAFIAGWRDGEAQRVAQADARLNLTAFVNENFEAEAAQRLELDAQIGDVNARVASEETARATADAAEATARQALAASLATDIGAVDARVDTVEAAKVDAQGAIAAVDQVVAASFGDIASMSQFTQWAIANADGSNSGFRFALDGQDVISAVSVNPDGSVDPSVSLRLSGGAIILDGDTVVTGDFTVGTANIGLLSVTEALIAPGAISGFADAYFFNPVSDVVTVGGAGNGGRTFSGNVGVPGSPAFGTVQGLVTTLLRARVVTAPGDPLPSGKTGEFRARLRFDGATFATFSGMIFDGEAQLRATSVRGAGAPVSAWEMQVDVIGAPGDVEILSRGFLVWEIKK